MNRAEIVALLNAIDAQQAAQIVDTELAITDSAQSLSRQQVVQLRQRLLDLPSTLLSELARAQAGERLEIAERERVEAETLARNRAAADQELIAQVRKKEWTDAHKTAVRRLALGGGTAELDETERYVYRRSRQEMQRWPGLTIAVTSWSAAAIFSLCPAGVSGAFEFHMSLGAAVGWVTVYLAASVGWGLLLDKTKLLEKMGRRARLILLYLPVAFATVAIVIGFVIIAKAGDKLGHCNSCPSQSSQTR